MIESMKILAASCALATFFCEQSNCMIRKESCDIYVKYHLGEASSEELKSLAASEVHGNPRAYDYSDKGITWESEFMFDFPYLFSGKSYHYSECPNCRELICNAIYYWNLEETYHKNYLSFSYKTCSGKIFEWPQGYNPDLKCDHLEPTQLWMKKNKARSNKVKIYQK